MQGKLQNAAISCIFSYILLSKDKPKWSFWLGSIELSSQVKSHLFI